MIPIASGVRIWIATGHTDMRRGMNGLARQVQEGLGRDPFAGDVFVFRGRSGSLIKALWHDGIGLSLYAKRLDRGRFVWPQTVDGVVALTAGQMSYLLEAIDWRNPQHTWRPELAGQANNPWCVVKKGLRGHGVCDSLAGVNAELAALPDDIDALKTALLAARAEAAAAIAQCSSDQALIAHLKLEIAKLNRDRFGPRSERTARLLDQMEFQLEELEASATEDDLAAEAAAGKTSQVAAFTRARPARRPFPAHLPRERVVEPGPCACLRCGGARLAKLGEDITETLEVIPRSWKVIQHVREKFTCRDCEAISQPPAPFRVTPRGWGGPSLLAMIMFEKFGQHQPLNRQAERYAREGVPLSLSTLADQVGACTMALMPLFDRLRAHVMAANRLHGDDTTVPVLARGKTDIARLWVYVRDDRPFGGPAPPAALFYYSRDRGGQHPQAHLATYAGILQADAYGGYGKLYAEDRDPGLILEAGCWAHARRKFFVLADIETAASRKSQGKQPAAISPLCLEAVRRIDELFSIERDITGCGADQRRARRQELSAPKVADLRAWMHEQRGKLSGSNDVAKAMDYMLKRWVVFARFLDDGQICLTNNAAERALRGIALGRKSWLFAGSDRGGQRAAVMYSLIVTAKMNDVDPQAWLAHVLASIAQHPVSRLDELLPWKWRPTDAAMRQAA